MKEQTLAKDAQQLLSQNDVRLSTGSTSLPLTPALAELLRGLLERLGNGESVTILSQQEELSTQQAADLLGVSRPYLIEQVLNQGRIPYRKVGSHRRIRLSDLLAYQQKDLRERKALADQITAEAQEMGLY
ncbi:helix-turn-helix domain-containing protein [Deinococcus aestuarii]|uniref:helix-turn-helix domain-containing protein n=1 Tax=Deinococcus aestuarii TaxID=2774531 RepID=UPI001C0B89BA|nr:helix-turn-helix domain-containing protein [Deinococcus aestuarii]